MLLDLAKLQREVENAPTALVVTLLMHAHDHLAVEPLHQCFKFATHDLNIGAVLVLAKTHPQHLITFFA